jgi:HEAT repeat protein
MHDWNRFFRHIPRNLSSSVYHIFEPEWKPKILGWFGSKDVSSAQKEALLYVLTHFEDACGDFFRYRAYLLAAEAIAYFKESVQADAIVHQLLLWSYAYFRQDKRDWRMYPSALSKAARNALEYTDRDRVIAQFEHLLHTIDSRLILRVAAERLHQLDPGNHCAIAALACLIQKVQSPQQLLEITASLSRAAPQHSAIVPALLKVIQTPIDPKKYEQVRTIRVAFLSLRTVAVGNQMAIAFLLQQLGDRQTQSLFMVEILQTLEVIAKGNLEVIKALKQMIQSTDEEWLIQLCVRTLGSVASGHPEIVPFLTQLLHDQQEPETQSFVAMNIIWLDPKHEKAIAILTNLLETYFPTISRNNSKINGLVEWAAVGLLRTDVTHAMAIEALFQLGQILLTAYPSQPSRELIKLREIDPDYQIEREILVRLIETAEPGSDVAEAIARLTQLDARDDRTISAVIHFVHSTQQIYNLEAVIDYFQPLKVHQPFIITTMTPKLVHLIQTSENEHERQTAAACLAKLIPNHPLAIETLMQVWEETDSDSVFLGLLRLGNVNETVLNALITLLQTKPISLLLSRELAAFCQNSPVELATQVVYRLKHLLEFKPKKSPGDDQYSPESLQQSPSLGWEPYWTPSDRADLCYQLIWDCAQNMTYPDFWRAWSAFNMTTQ